MKHHYFLTIVNFVGSSLNSLQSSSKMPFSTLLSKSLLLKKSQWIKKSLYQNILANCFFLALSSFRTFGSNVEPINKLKENFRLDYSVSNYKVSDIYLKFDLDLDKTVITTKSLIYKSINGSAINYDLTLDGEELDLDWIKINGEVLNKSEYIIDKNKLIISGKELLQYLNNDNCFQLETRINLYPTLNLALSGLYKSGGGKTYSLLCTQCEAMGFRKITYHIDRPDILTKFKVYLQGDIKLFPVLLSNGNLIDSGLVINDSTKHWVIVLHIS
jgi:aminopeptidase N